MEEPPPRPDHLDQAVDVDVPLYSPKQEKKVTEAQFKKTFEDFQYAYHNITRKPKAFNKERIAASLNRIFELQEKEERERAALAESAGVGANKKNEKAVVVLPSIISANKSLWPGRSSTTSPKR